MKKSRQNRQRRLQFEDLESRQMMAVTGTLSGSTLNIFGTAGADSISLKQTGGVISIAGVRDTWAASRITAIVIDVKGGGDTVSLNSLANGGQQTINENIRVTSSAAGSTSVALANGRSLSFTGAGHTVTVTSAGVISLDGRVQTFNNSNPTPPPAPPAPQVLSWFDTNVVDTALRSLGHNLYLDGSINRSDMISLLKSAEDGNVIDATELTDLRNIVGNSTLFGAFDYVRKLGSYVVNNNVANASYQGGALGNLSAGAATAKMETLINKWFLGLDRPTATGAYRLASGQLFVSGVSYTDINQGYLGDCYFLCALAETALKSPSTIMNMFVVNGDGTYTVRFYNNGQAEYVTVDSYLPTDSSGRLIYAKPGLLASNSGNELWTALAEKAYAQINQMGFIRGGLSGSGQNSYAAVEGGYIYAALGQITGQGTSAFTMTSGPSSFTAFVNAFNTGKSIGFASYASPASGSVVGGHAYAVIGYNASNQTITLFNPWGTQYGFVTMTWSQIQANFQYFDRTA